MGLERKMQSDDGYKAPADSRHQNLLVPSLYLSRIYQRESEEQKPL